MLTNFDKMSNQNGAPSERAKPVANQPIIFTPQNQIHARAFAGHSALETARAETVSGIVGVVQRCQPTGKGRSSSFALSKALSISTGVPCPVAVATSEVVRAVVSAA